MTRPGIAKARGLPLVVVRATTLVCASEPRWREIFATADIVSEGGARQEAAGPVWYGTTSLVLRSGTAGLDAELLAQVVARDIHVRLRAVRTAVREACLRASCRLGRFACEIRVVPDPQGVRIDVDVQAPLIEGRRRARPKAPRADSRP